MKTFRHFFFLMCCLVFAFGCGGSSSSSGGPVGTDNVPVYITDAPGDYSHAWITVKQVDLIGKNGPVTVYQDATGQTIDLVTLAGTIKQQFALLGIANVPAERDRAIRITLDQNVTLVPTGSSTGTSYVFAGSSGGVKVFTVSTRGEGRKGVIADFDLSNWRIVGGQVVASAKGGDESKLGEGTHVRQHFRGSVASLAGTAPTLTFDLVHGHDKLHVSTTADTVFSNEDGSPNPTLQNGAEVMVEGTFAEGTFSVTATAIVIASSEHHEPVFARGLVLSVGGDSFTLSPQNVEGFHPASTEIHVFTPAGTMFLQDGVSMSSTDFYAALAAGSDVMVHGTYNAANNTLTASHVNLVSHHEGDHRHHLGVAGPISVLDSHAGTFDLTIQRWEGMEMHAGDVVHVVTNEHTRFDGVNLANLENGAVLQVAGDLDGTNLTATLVKNGHHE
ncbi:DUF5666 domain-containing protein [Fimbriimonas ginsengisoli]|uniref:DUF5666 domain-containing protein n=1 Tax=Fimbriimonas ginsengisoli TaxID=1005039 RepID=UPI0004B8C73E|nr:DUF5666 domain-containing protein [Fimbriimonas ginsengisoli]